MTLSVLSGRSPARWLPLRRLAAAENIGRAEIARCVSGGVCGEPSQGWLLAIPLRRLSAPESSGQADIVHRASGFVCGEPSQGWLLGTTNPRRGSWTSAHQPVRALRDSEPAVWPQPCEGDPLAKAGLYQSASARPTSPAAPVDSYAASLRKVGLKGGFAS